MAKAQITGTVRGIEVSVPELPDKPKAEQQKARQDAERETIIQVVTAATDRFEAVQKAAADLDAAKEAVKAAKAALKEATGRYDEFGRSTARLMRELDTVQVSRNVLPGLGGIPSTNGEGVWTLMFGDTTASGFFQRQASATRRDDGDDGDDFIIA